ncbi:MAG: glycosyltransferase family 2 protein [Vicinamibacteria bacterium]
MDLSYCVVNTNGRQLLLACLAAIRDHGAADLETEVLVVDNASDDGSADAVEAWNASADGLGERLRLIRGERREGKAALDSLLLGEASGELCLLLNEDSELRPGAVEALIRALRSDPRAAAAGASLLDPQGRPQPCAWRLPGLTSSLAGALFLHRVVVAESGGASTREVGWVQSAAMLVRKRAAERVGYLDPAFFVYSDETDFCKRLHDAGWRILHVPGAEVVHHEQLATDEAARERRVVEFHRGRDRYLRKHHGPVVALVARALGAWTYAVRAVGALVLPGHDASLYWLHARQALRPERGEGLREAADAYNSARSRRS